MSGPYKKKKVLLAKLYCHPAEHGIPYDPKFLSLALFYLRAYALKDAAVRKNADFSIRLFDHETDSEQILRSIYHLKPDIVAFSAYLSEITKTIELCRKIKYVLPRCAIIIGGPSVRYPEKFLEEHPFFDIVVEGEGEVPFTRIIRALVSGKTLSGIPATTFRYRNEIIINKELPERLEIDDIPIIFDEKFIEDTGGIAICETSRGCLNRCKFCGLGLIGMRYHSMERIEHDLGIIFSRREIRRVFIGDANFFTDKDRSLQILEIIQRHNRHKTQVEFYADFLTGDENLLAACRRAYIHDSLRIPIQSLSRGALELSGRSWFNFDVLRESVHTVLRHFPGTWGEIIIGLPGDNYDGIKGSIRWCVENGLTTLKCHRLKSLPGSEYTRHPEKYGLVADECPPHATYRSNTFSFDEILRAEDLNRNYQIFSPFIRTFDVLRLRGIGIDVVEEAEALDPFTPEWEGLFQKDSEENIVETKREAANLLANHIARRHKLNKTITAFLADLFKFRYDSRSLYNFYKQHVLYNPEYTETTERIPGQAPIPPMRQAVVSDYDILKYLAGKTSMKRPSKKKACLLLLYCHTTNTIVPWQVEQSGAFDPVLDNLGRLLDAAARHDRNAASATALATQLLEKGYLFFRKE